jgi:polyisoprenoid-binding protein YceI
VTFAVKHLMIFVVRGWFADVTGTVVMDDSDLAKAEVDVVIDAHSIATREAHRDAHLKSRDFFDAEKFPQITFKSTRVTDVEGDQFTLVGDLTILGVSREVTLDVTSEGRVKDPKGAERAGYSAVARVNRKDFGLMWNETLETGGVLVGDEVKISLDLELVKQ